MFSSCHPSLAFTGLENCGQIRTRSSLCVFICFPLLLYASSKVCHCCKIAEILRNKPDCVIIGHTEACICVYILVLSLIYSLDLLWWPMVLSNNGSLFPRDHRSFAAQSKISWVLIIRAQVEIFSILQICHGWQGREDMISGYHALKIGHCGVIIGGGHNNKENAR